MAFDMLAHWRRKFELYYSYLADKVDHYEDAGNGQLLVYLRDGTRVLYDTFEDTCRNLPKDSQSMTESECNAEFAARLRTIMKRRGCTQRELSARTGFSQSAISKYVSGKTMPSFYSVDKIAKALGCSVDELRYV